MLGQLPKVSIVFNVFKSEANLEKLLTTVEGFASKHAHMFALEVVFVIDGSPDRSEEYLKTHLQPPRSFAAQVHVLTRNFGGPSALRCGLTNATGDYFASMACDLQEPLDFITQAFRILNSGEIDICFGQRMGRDDPWGTRLFSFVFWGLYRRFVQQDLPKGGADLFLCNRAVRDSIISLKEDNYFLIGLMFWIGYRRTFIPYTRAKREVGRSSWSLRKRLNYMFDAFFSFSQIPIKMLIAFGWLGIFIASVLGMLIFAGKVFGTFSVPGYAASMVAICFFGGLNSLGVGLLGEYMWRTFRNSQQRPLYIVRESLSFATTHGSAHKTEQTFAKEGNVNEASL